MQLQEELDGKTDLISQLELQLKEREEGWEKLCEDKKAIESLKKELEEDKKERAKEGMSM